MDLVTSDDVEAPEECTTFLSLNLSIAEGWYDHEEDVDEIDKCGRGAAAF